MYLDEFIRAHTLTLNSIWLILITLKVNLNSSKNSFKFCALKCTLLLMILNCLFVLIDVWEIHIHLLPTYNIPVICSLYFSSRDLS